MANVKSSNSGFLSILRCVLLSLAITLVGIVVLAVVLKFTDLSMSAINSANNIIKGIAIFLMIFCIKRRGADKLLFKSLFAGLLYSVLTFIIFSILNGSLVFSLSVLYDVLFAVIVSVISSVILNLLSKKTI